MTAKLRDDSQLRERDNSYVWTAKLLKFPFSSDASRPKATSSTRQSSLAKTCPMTRSLTMISSLTLHSTCARKASKRKEVCA